MDLEGGAFDTQYHCGVQAKCLRGTKHTLTNPELLLWELYVEDHTFDLFKR